LKSKIEKIIAFPHRNIPPFPERWCNHVMLRLCVDLLLVTAFLL